MAKAPKKNQEAFLISELAAQLDMSPHTIRFYEEKGLISPERTPGNQRIYTPKDRARLKLILRGKRFGFSLDEIAEMIGMADTNANELCQIDKSLAYGTKKLKEIRKRKEELVLLEKDLMSLRDNLLKRRRDLQKK
ncbi:MAG: MerR family transcriptional regulator [Desulfobacterales bacterium]